MNKKIYLFILILFAVTNLSCSVYETFVNMSRLKFKLGDVNNFTISGVSVSNKSRLQDFSSVELIKLSSSFAQGKLPVSFTLNVEAKNPNDGKGGYPKTSASINSFPWRLEIDDKETITGNIGSPVSVPGTGEVVTIPMQMSLDLIPFFRDKGYEAIINLALNIGGYKKSASSLALYAQPTVNTAIGNISYPRELKIVSYEFTE
ncbi:MAG: hypothetical protein R6W90_00755 [Ignavibacteriaceae bacterium]